MNSEVAIMNILSNDSSYSALVGSGTNAKIYYDEAEQTKTLPYAILEEDDVVPNDTKSGASTLDEDMIYVTHYADTKAKAVSMSVAARNALDRKTGTFNGIIVIGLEFITQRSSTLKLVDKKAFIKEQKYKVMTQQ